MQYVTFLRDVISARHVLPRDVTDRLIILASEFSDEERDEAASIIRDVVKQGAAELNAGIRKMKKIIREMKAVKEEHERSIEHIPSLA